MANEKTDGSEAPAKPLTIIQRVAKLEGDVLEVSGAVPQIIMAVNRVTSELKNQLDLQREIVSVLSDMADEVGGEGEVHRRVTANRKERSEKMVQAEKDALAQALKDGLFVALGKVEDPCIVVGLEISKDGEPVSTDNRYPYPTGYHQRYLNGYLPDSVAKMTGQGVGFKFDTASGGTFEILGIYRAVEKPEESAADQLPTSEELDASATDLDAEIEGSLEPAPAGTGATAGNQ